MTSNPFDDAAAAARYDAARALPSATVALWLDALRAVLPTGRISAAIDLGCGTGRFSGALAAALDCQVIGVEPSLPMLAEAAGRAATGVLLVGGSAEALPLASGTADLVFMSQVYHHLADKRGPLSEVRRTLRHSGFLVVRTTTRENLDELDWLACFPDARHIEEARLPSRDELVGTVVGESFRTVHRETLRQLFAASYAEYVEKIGRRALSALIAIDDAAFERGMRRLRELAAAQPVDTPVYEPVDLLVFEATDAI
jgi:SAM-dependent methyltransferase